MMEKSDALVIYREIKAGLKKKSFGV